MSALFTLPEILSALTTIQGHLLTYAVNTQKPHPLNTDTRSIQTGDFFIPLVGANFNGHGFVSDAFANGAQGALVNLSEWQANQQAWQHLPNLIGVEDTLTAYMALANFHRHRGHPNLRVVALTGSSGKTTTKNMLYAAFSGIKKTQKTQKNFNNEVGVSQTLLSLEADTELLIVEMGMRGRHQIDILSRCAQPDIAIITNIGPAHIEMLGSLEAIAEAKLEITEGLNPDTGILLTWGDDPLLEKMTPQHWKTSAPYWQRYSKNEITRQPDSTHPDHSRLTYQGHAFILPAPGLHNALNALAAIKAGLILGLPLAGLLEGLSRYQPEEGRGEKISLTAYTDAWVINDAYNANPDSCRASLSTFFELPLSESQKRILILGGMKELGPFSESYHQELGSWLASQPLNALITIGPEARAVADAARANAARQDSFPVSHLDELSEADFKSALSATGVSLDQALVLLKGSRAYHLESVIPFL